ncbi:DUF488 domain-containing protein [Mesorhizobium sp. B2-4-12]|uniref:DUF488 domain-containing protein n=1 Tax=unclassified Mesorhizobium TaxID=325217 RepID=UPI001128F70B|nr:MULTISPECIES: DUF488 domain-containing protein [unclassified Mesorhizobium]TPK88875.1 DUF488 domain-containing protein [Mesorhizobium sp. B2-4-12]TPK97865.1 DUF488 domain-containing protein [Mesorhizobium sp. B2-4-14]
MRETEITVWTIGHSMHTYERLLQLLRSAEITAVADVRTSPYSRHFPQFGKDALRDELRMDGIAYSFLGKELGGRPTGSQYYCDGIADYELMAKSLEFRHGIQRVLDGAQKYRVALMCSEHDPLDCHRCLLVGRALAKRGVGVKHIHPNGGILTQGEIEERLLKLESHDGGDLFMSSDERLAAAYRKRARKVAYTEPSNGASDAIAAE